MARTNQAYDLERFQPREPHLVALKNTKKVQEDSRRRTRRQSVLNVIVYLAIAVVVMSMVGYFITCNVRLTEMNKQLMDGQATLNAMQSEQVRLQSELAGLTSAERVNQYAQENGLLPVGSSQVYYIEEKEQDQVSLANENDSWFSKAWDALLDLLS